MQLRQQTNGQIIICCCVPMSLDVLVQTFIILIGILFRWVNLTKEEKREVQVAAPSLANLSCLKAREDLQGLLFLICYQCKILFISICFTGRRQSPGENLQESGIRSGCELSPCFINYVFHSRIKINIKFSFTNICQ